MPKLSVIRSAVVVEAEAATKGVGEGSHTVSVIGGVPAALDGVGPVITVQLSDAERDTPRLLRAAEQLLPLHRDAPGVVVLDEDGTIEGVIARPDLEKAVLRLQRGEYAALAKGLGLRGDYQPPAGDVAAPFVYWKCPRCGSIQVPPEGHEDDEPPKCRRHRLAVQMERRVHGGQ